MTYFSAILYRNHGIMGMWNAQVWISKIPGYAQKYSTVHSSQFPWSEMIPFEDGKYGGTGIGAIKVNTT